MGRQFILTLVVIGIVILLLLNEFYKRVIIRNEQEAYIRRGAMEKGYKVVAFGSSYCRYAFDFKGVGIRGYNFGFVAQFFYYTDKMIRAFRKTYEPHCWVIITISNLVFANVGKGLYGSERYIQFLDRKTLADEFSWKNYFMQVIFPLFIPSKYHIKKSFYEFLCFFKSDPYTSEYNSLSDDGVEKAAKQRCNNWCKQFGLKDTRSDDIPAELEIKFVASRMVLTELIQYCLAEGLRPILVVTPVSAIMNAQFSDRFLNKVLFDNIRLANIQEIPYLNYLHDVRFQDKDLYFESADFLNARGRLEFTRVVLEDLRKLEEH